MLIVESNVFNQVKYVNCDGLLRKDALLPIGHCGNYEWGFMGMNGDLWRLMGIYGYE